MDTPSDVSRLITSKIGKVKKNIPKSVSIEDNKFECLVCENIYESILKLRIHVITDHSGRKVVGKLPFMCKKCGLLYRKRSYLNQHYLNKHPTVHFKGKPLLSYLPVLVEVQKEVVETASKDESNDLVKVQRTFVEERYRCDLCSVICKNKAAIRHHKLSKHTEQNDWKCLQCSYTTKFKQYYIRHIANKHSKSSEVINRSKHICEICGYATHVKGHLDAHRQTHLENKNYMCEICGRRTKTKNAMISHRRMHLKDKKYSCGVGDCQFKTVHLTSLKHHRLSHDPEKNTLYCDKCNFKTFNKYSMKTHVQQHIIGEKVLRCALCDFTTAQNVNLKHHMHKHSKDMKFKCHLCNFTYRYENSLRKHMKKHNNDGSTNNINTHVKSKSNSKKNIRQFKLKQIKNIGISCTSSESKKVDSTTEQAVLNDSMHNDINKKHDFNCIGEENLGSDTANYDLNSPVPQYINHDNRRSLDDRDANRNYRSYSNNSDTHGNSIVQYNIDEKHNNPFVTSATVINDERSSNYLENHNNFVQYNVDGMVEDDKYYINQNNTSSSSQYNLVNEIDSSQFESQNYFTHCNTDNRSNLNDTGGHLRSDQAICYDQIANHNNNTVRSDVEKHSLHGVINKNHVSKIEKSFIRYKHCLERSDTFAQHNTNNLIKDPNYEISFVDYNIKDKNDLNTAESNVLENSNADEIRIINQTINKKTTFSETNNHINVLENYEISQKQDSDQIQTSASNSFILYDINEKGGQIELRNDDSFIKQSGEGRLSQIQHSKSSSLYVNNSHCSNEESFYKLNPNKEHSMVTKNLTDSANAIEIVVNKGVLMMSVDCDAFSSYQNFDYFQD